MHASGGLNLGELLGQLQPDAIGLVETGCRLNATAFK